MYKRLNEQNAGLEKLNAKLFAVSRRVPLTGLGNRLRLSEDAETLDANVDRCGRGHCAMILDVCFFKPYNDLYGRLAGDEVLRQVASVVSRNLRAGRRPTAMAARSFLVILPEQNLESASVAAERLRRSVRYRHPAQGGKSDGARDGQPGARRACARREEAGRGAAQRG